MPKVNRILFFLVQTIFCFLSLSTQLQAQNAVEDSLYIIGEIKLQGNEQTKPHIVLRELAFATGDTLTQNQLQLLRLRGTRQIFNLKLFTSVNIEIGIKDSVTGTTPVTIYLKERWYLFVVPILEVGDRNFNQWWISKRLDRLNYGMSVTRFNMRGRNETIRVNLQSGFTRKASLDYSFPYINKKLTIGAAINFTYSDNKEVWYKTEKNKLQFYRNPERVLYRRYKSGLEFTYRKKIYTTQTLGAEYNRLWVADTVSRAELNPNFFGDSATKQTSIYTYYRCVYDMRDFRAYALNGFMLSAEVGNYSFLSGQKPIVATYITAEFYKKLAPRNYFSISVSGKYSSTKTQPYNLFRALGYGYFVRGFEYYVVDGQHFALAKINYRYTVLPQKQITLNTTKLKKFRTIPFAAYLKAYYDAGYVDNPNATIDNTFTNTYLGGMGVGIDIVTYYDRVFMFEYSFNNKGQSGLFLHYTMTF